MPVILLKTNIKADIKTCFDLARNIDFHQRSLAHSNEKAIDGKISGLIGLGESVTWEATHFGIKQHLTSKITAFESPIYFVDEMVSGTFKSLRHEHIFEARDNYTLMTDQFIFKSPFGVMGRLANILFLNKYMTNLLMTRNTFLVEEAEKIAVL